MEEQAVPAAVAAVSDAIGYAPWLWLAGAIVLEVAGTVCMKLAQGFTKPIPSLLVVLFYGTSIAAMTFAQKNLPVSVMYAVWAGAGTALIAAIGALWFREPMNAVKLISIGLIILGVVGLNLGGTKH